MKKIIVTLALSFSVANLVFAQDIAPASQARKNAASTSSKDAGSNIKKAAVKNLAAPKVRNAIDSINNVTKTPMGTAEAASRLESKTSTFKNDVHGTAPIHNIRPHRR